MIEAILGLATAAIIILCAALYILADEADKKKKRVKMPTHSDYMRHDIAKLLECDKVILLPNWETSKGARAEITVAEVCEIPIEKISEAALHSIIIEYRQKVMQK